MAGPPRHPEPASEQATGTPRWLSVIGIVVVIMLVLVLVVLHLTGILGPGAH